jgi:hypothetical protein
MSLFGSVALIGSGGGRPNVIDDFTSAGCWYCCPGAKVIQVITIGGGGGGGNGSDTTTSGCASFYLSGGGGGQGGGISMCCFQGFQVGASGPVVVGGGGAANCCGCNSVWCSAPTACVIACGGRFGSQTSGVKNTTTSGGFGTGCGNVKNGNAGGGGTTLNGTNGSNSVANTTRGGGAGGSAQFCNVIPISCTFGSAGSSSTTTSIDLTQTVIDLNTIGCGGRGGNSSVDGNRSVAATSGGAGFVRVIQYF